MPPVHERIIIAADDLTGAADSGMYFAEAGIPTHICLNTQNLPDFGAIALVTNTRHSSAGDTEARSYELLRGVIAKGSETLVYQKIDSTLRGHPAHALAGAMRAMAVDHALVAPAYPDQGRATLDGQQLVYGRPLKESTFRHQVQTGDLRQIFRRRFPVVAHLATGAQSSDLGSKQIYLADAVTDDDLDTLAAAALASDILLFCGSAGLAKALAKALSPAYPPLAPSAVLPASGAILALIGSRHPASRKQIAFAAAQGMALVEVSATQMINAPETFLDGLCATMSKTGALILTTPDYDLPLEPQIISAQLAEIARLLIMRCHARALVLSGGDTAQNVARALGATRVRLLGAIEPGIAVGRWQDGFAQGQIVVTKAGGFGTERSLHRALQS